MDIGVAILIMLGCLLMEAFFSGSELGVVNADPMELRHMAAKGSRGARLALDMLKNPEWLLSTTLVGTNIAVVTNTTVTTALFIELLGERWSWLAILVVAPLIWIFGEIVPKSIFQQKANTLTPKAIFGLRAASLLFFPILIVFTTLTRLVTRANGHNNPFTMREELLTMLQMAATESDGDIEPMEQNMIRRMFTFSETTAGEVMVPLVDVAAIDERATCGEATRLAVDRAHQSLLVHRDRVDKVVGVLDTLELLGEAPDVAIAPHVKAVDYIPGSKSIRDLLRELRQSGTKISVVVDEFGGAEGIVSIEDIMEEVVEEIHDEFDEGEVDDQWVRKVEERHYIVSARIELDTLKEKLELELPRGKYATLAGFLLEKARDVPQTGEVVRYKGISFTIEQGLAHVIQEVRIRW